MSNLVPIAAPWWEAYNAYWYPVRLTAFKGKAPFATRGFFVADVRGNANSTEQFEARFRAKAGHDLAAWYEVTYWKLYSQGVRADRETSQAIDWVNLLPPTPSAVWKLGQKAAHDLVTHAKIDSNFRKLSSVFFRTPVLATTMTFLAFSDPQGRIPMLDRRIRDWAITCGPQHGLYRPHSKGNLTFHGDREFALAWVGWCREVALKLNAKGPPVWNARMVEMAVYTAADKTYTGPQLPVL